MERGGRRASSHVGILGLHRAREKSFAPKNQSSAADRFVGRPVQRASDKTRIEGFCIFARSNSGFVRIDARASSSFGFQPK